MKFEIRSNDLDSVEKHLKMFIREEKKEVRKALADTEDKLIARKVPIKQSIRDFPVEMEYMRKDDCILFVDNLPEPPLMKKRIYRNMSSFLKEFLKSMGDEVEIKWIK